MASEDKKTEVQAPQKGSPKKGSGWKSDQKKK